MIALLLALLLAAPAESYDDLQAGFHTAVAGRAWLQVEVLVPRLAAADPAGLAFVRKALDDATARSLRRAIVRGLADVECDDGVEYWEPRCAAKDPFERAVAIAAYAKASPALGSLLAERLIHEDADGRVRQAAAEVLAREGDAGAALTIMRVAARLDDRERRALVDMAVGMTGAIDGALALSEHPTVEVRLAAVRILAEHGEDGEARAALARTQADRDLRIALVSRAGLDRIEGKSQLPALLARHKKHHDFWPVLEAICEARLYHAGAAAFLSSELRGGAAELRPKVAEALGHAWRDEAVPALVNLMEKKRPWQLSVGAIRGLDATRAHAAIPPLIEELPRAVGRRRHEIVKALTSLTAQPFGDTPDAWEKWWAARGERFRVPAAAPPVWEKDPDGTGFFGIKLWSRAAVFVCDVSASMAGKPLERLQRELSGVVTRFPAKGRFNVVFFGTDVHPWQEKLQRAGRSAKDRALKHIRAQRTGGETNIGDALFFALEDPDVDTIVLLTDGLPTAGRYKHASDLRRAFLEANRTRMVELHVICIGTRSYDLAVMARSSGGRYLERR